MFTTLKSDIHVLEDVCTNSFSSNVFDCGRLYT